MLALMFAMSLARAGHDQKINPADLPPAVTKTLNERYPGARVDKVEREEKKARTKYEVKACHGGRRMEVEFDAAGAITDVEDEGAC